MVGHFLKWGKMPNSEAYYDRDDGRAIVVGVGAIDWLTCTTFNPFVVQKWENLVRERYPSEPTTHREKMYSGEDYEGVAKILAGRQGGQPHFKLNFSGVDADHMAILLYQHDALFRDDITITRIDLQITTRKYKNRMDIARIGQNLKDGKYGQVTGSGKTTIQNLSSETGDTLYIGSMLSEKRTKWYTKFVLTIDGTEVELERYEVMYRRETAAKAARMILRDGQNVDRGTINDMIAGDMERLPIKMKAQMRCYAYLRGNNAIYVPRDHTPRLKTNGTRWMMKMADSFKKHASQKGENGVIVRGVLMRALVMSLTDEPLEDVERWSLLSPEGEIVQVFGMDYTSDTSEGDGETDVPTG